MSGAKGSAPEGRGEPDRREALREAIDRYFDVPLAIASLVLVLLTVIELTGELKAPWSRRVGVLVWVLWGLFLVEFAIKFTLARVKRRYLRTHWLDALVVVVPVLRVLRVLRVFRAARALPVVRLLVFGGRGSGAAIELLRRRHLGQLALVTVLVILLGAALGFLLEAGAPGTPITTFGDALWWAAALITTVGSQLNPVTPGGRTLAFVLMLYAMAVFTYFTAALASVLVGVDATKPPEAARERAAREEGRRSAASDVASSGPAREEAAPSPDEDDGGDAQPPAASR